MSTTQLEGLVTRLEAVVQKLEKGSGEGNGPEETARFVEDYDAYISEFVDPYLKASAALGEVANEQAQLFKAACDEERKLLVIASTCSKPSDKVAQELAGNVIKKVNSLVGARDHLGRKSNQVSHVKSACEGASVFGWTLYPKTPMVHVKETKESAKFYSNKVLTETKNGDKKAEHKAWVDSYLAIFDGLVAYIKQHHTTGLSWNSSGPVATPTSQAAAKSSVPAPPDLSVPPPPMLASNIAPPPMPAGPPAGAGMSELLGDLNKGAAVTQGLKKVTNDMKTHKNPELRKHHVPVPYKAPSGGGYKPVVAKKTATPAKPPVFQLQGKKWIVENQTGKTDLKIEDSTMKQTVYIYKCTNSNLIISQKVNSIVLDSCKKMGLVFSSVVSGVEIINCQSVQVQAQGQMPTASIDKTDGCILYLNKECIESHIVTAKSSEMNVCIPKADGDFEEFPIVEQFRSFYDPVKKSFTTVPSEIIG